MFKNSKSSQIYKHKDTGDTVIALKERKSSSRIWYTTKISFKYKAKQKIHNENPKNLLSVYLYWKMLKYNFSWSNKIPERYLDL